MITRGFTGRQQTPDIAKRLPSGQSLTADFPVLSEGPTPQISTDDWSFTLKVGPKPVAEWSWAKFNALRRPIRSATFTASPNGRSSIRHGTACWSTMCSPQPASNPRPNSYWPTPSTAVTPRVKSFALQPSAPFAFRAGQHVDVRLTAPDGYRAERSYSIASAPENPASIELAIERLDDGEVSPFFHDVAQVGDTIELRGPFGGHFVWEPEDGGPLLLLGGGSGVVPLMSMLRERAAKGSDVPALLLFSSRRWENVIFRDELLALAARNDGFQLALALTRDRPRRPQDFGRRVGADMVAELVRRLPGSPRHVFVCGGNPFVEAVSQGALAASLHRSLIRTEPTGLTRKKKGPLRIATPRFSEP